MDTPSERSPVVVSLTVQLDDSLTDDDAVAVVIQALGVAALAVPGVHRVSGSRADAF